MITIKEIARLAGVSAKTAERALSGATKDKRRDARERADRVRQIAAAHGYRPSELALALRRGSTRSFGFLVDVLTDQFWRRQLRLPWMKRGERDTRSLCSWHGSTENRPQRRWRDSLPQVWRGSSPHAPPDSCRWKSWKVLPDGISPSLLYAAAADGIFLLRLLTILTLCLRL